MCEPSSGSYACRWTSADDSIRRETAGAVVRTHRLQPHWARFQQSSATKSEPPRLLVWNARISVARRPLRPRSNITERKKTSETVAARRLIAHCHSIDVLQFAQAVPSARDAMLWGPPSFNHTGRRPMSPTEDEYRLATLADLSQLVYECTALCQSWSSAVTS
jgi:hypothetical protein